MDVDFDGELSELSSSDEDDEDDEEEEEEEIVEPPETQTNTEPDVVCVSAPIVCCDGSYASRNVTNCRMILKALALPLDFGAALRRRL